MLIFYFRFAQNHKKNIDVMLANDFKFLNTTKQLAVPTGYVPFMHIPRENIPAAYRLLSLCQYPITYSVDYEGFCFVWEPRDPIDNEYHITSWSGQIKDFKRHYENRKVSLGDSIGGELRFAHFWLPVYPTIRRIYVGTHYMINYNNHERFMNPRFLVNHEFVRIEYKLYEQR
jgi:hypothetical protein